jgi:hypothetical protein
MNILFHLKSLEIISITIFSNLKFTPTITYLQIDKENTSDINNIQSNNDNTQFETNHIQLNTDIIQSATNNIQSDTNNDQTDSDNTLFQLWRASEKEPIAPHHFFLMMGCGTMLWYGLSHVLAYYELEFLSMV